MTITKQVERPGAKTLARATYRLDPQTTQHNPAGAYPDSTVKGNLAVGRKGQLMVVDRVDIFGVGVVGNAQCVTLRGSLQSDASGDDLHFSLQSASNESVVRNLSIENFGYVTQPTFSQPSVVPGGSNWVEANNYLGYYVPTTSGTGEDSFELFLPGLRYLERESAFRQGVKQGAWGSRFVYLAAVSALADDTFITNGQLCAAPASDKFNTIRTLIVRAVGGATNYRIGVGSSSVGTVTLAAGSSTTVLNVTTPTLVASAHVGKVVVLLTGNIRAEVRRISANTTTTITVDTAFSAAPATSVTLVIIEPVHEWYSSIDVNGFGVFHHQTDVNIPTPAGTALWFYAEAVGNGAGTGVGNPPASSFDNQLSVIAGVEVADVAGHNFISLAGVPQ